MLLIFSFIILGRFSFHIEANERRYSLPFLFGFLPGGTYSIEVKNNETDNFIFIIATNDDLDNFMKEQNLYRPCEVTYPIDYINMTQLHRENNTIKGTIEKKGRYNTTVLSCEYFHHELSFDLIYLNPNSCLSYTVQNILITGPVTVSIAFLLFILWIVNWMKNFTMRNNIHAIITFSFIFFIIQKIFFLLETFDRNKSDNVSHYKSYRQMFQLLHATYFFSSFLSLESQIMIEFFKRLQYVFYFINICVSFYLSNSLLELNYMSDDLDIDIHLPMSICLYEIMLLIYMLVTPCFVSGILNVCFSIGIFISAIIFMLFFSVVAEENDFILEYYIVFIIDLFHVIFLVAFGSIFKITEATKKNYLSLQVIVE